MLKALQEPEESVGYESEVEKALKTNWENPGSNVIEE